MEIGVLVVIFILLAGIIASNPQEVSAHHEFLGTAPIPATNVKINLDPANPINIKSVSFQMANFVSEEALNGLTLVVSAQGQHKYECVQLEAEWLCTISDSPAIASVEQIWILSASSK